LILLKNDEVIDFTIGIRRPNFRPTWYHRRPSTAYPQHRTHDWLTILRYDPSRSSKDNYLYLIWKPVCDFLLVIIGNLGSCSV